MFAVSPQTPPVLDRSFKTFCSQLPPFSPSRQVPQDLRPGNPSRQFWASWSGIIACYGFRCSLEEYQHDMCWGWTIFRTSYDNDEEFNQAVTAIQRLALVRLEDEYRYSRTRGTPDNDTADAVEEKLSKVSGPSPLNVAEAWRAMVGHAQDALSPGELLTPDRVITQELVRHYHNIVVQDSQALDGADVSKVWDYAHALNLEEREQGPRGGIFIYLDKESIHRLAQAPSQQELLNMAPEDRSKTAWQYWIKVATTECEVTEDGDDTDQMMNYPLGRRRMRVYDFFDCFLHLCEGSLDEMSIEGRDRERFDCERLFSGARSEWEFCSSRHESFLRDPWLRELYGERIRMKY